MDEDLPICERVRKDREGALPYWRPLWDARTEERAFLDGDRYEDDVGSYNKDRRRQQFAGQETTNVNRHKAAVITSTPRSLTALAVDRASDPQDAETAVSIMNWELDNPQKGFDDVDEEVVQDAVDARAGCAILDYDPDMGAFGETFWRWKDANLIMFEPGFANPHHPKCGWMQELRRMPIADVKANGKLRGKAKWYHTEDLRADGNLEAVSGSSGERYDGVAFSRDVMGVPGSPTDDDHIWVLFCWYKNDPDTYKRVGNEQEIPKGERYLGCDNPECEYRSDTQDELIADKKMEAGETLPDVLDPCPMCHELGIQGSTISRRDIRSIEEDVLIYPRGRRLVIMPALQACPGDEPYYDGPWPIPTARGFPMYWVTSYLKPGRPMGDSDTTRNWEAQVASDQLMTMAFDRIMRHQQYYVMPQVGLYDYRGNRFEYRDDQYNVMFSDTSDANRPEPRPFVVEGSSLDASWTGYWQAVQQVLLGHQGISDFGLTPESSKNIAASTVAQLNQIGEIPVAHFIRRRNRALGRAIGVHWDYIRHTYKRKRLARLRIGDDEIVDRLKGDELANFDFVFAEAPPFTGLERARKDAFDALLQVALQTPEWIDIFAEINKYPPSVVRKVKRQLELQRAAADEAGSMGGAPEAGPDGAPLPQGGGSNPLEAMMAKMAPGPAPSGA